MRRGARTTARKRVELAARMLGGDARVSRSGVPHALVPIAGGRFASVCWFGRGKVWRLFWPYGAVRQRRLDYTSPELLERAVRLLRHFGARPMPEKARESAVRRLLARTRVVGGATGILALFACWEYVGAGRGGHRPWDSGGDYGNFWHDGRNAYPHQVGYELAFGPVPLGHVPDHVCQNRRCWNPLHLEAVTVAENARRATARRRS